MYNIYIFFVKMLKIHIEEPTKLDFNKMKNMSKTEMNNCMKGKIVSNIKAPSIKLKKTTSLQLVKPQITINRFTHILGVDKETANEYYNRGARSIEELVKDCKKYELNLIQLNGCLYFNDLITPITQEEESLWIEFMKKNINVIDEPILSTIVQSRPNGIHSRIEVMLCVTNNCLQIMSGIFDRMGRENSVPNGMESLFEIYNDNVENCSISRIKSVCCIDNKHIIFDITIYLPQHHPFPLLREYRPELIDSGYDLKDTGLFKDDKKILFRDMLGRDNPANINEIREFIS